MTHSLQQLVALATEAAVAAGQRLLEGQADVLKGVVERRSAVDVTTSSDLAAEKIIVGCIRDACPEDSILGEEGSAHAGESNRRWIIDPLDGTGNFVRGWKVFAVSIGVEISGSMDVGVIHLPATGETFTAFAGGGALRNGTALVRTEMPLQLSDAYVGVEGAFGVPARHERAALLPTLARNAGDIRYTGSAAASFGYLADGRLDALFVNGCYIWDVAAGYCIAREAGCFVHGEGEGERIHRVIAGVPTLETEFSATTCRTD